MSDPQVRCAIYTRTSTDERLALQFNSLDAQRDAGESLVASRSAEGWVANAGRYDDGGFSGGSLDRPALRRLIEDIKAGMVNAVVVYKLDRLTRSLRDFADLTELFEEHNVAIVSVTQSFSTADSMGRLMLNVLLSFAQFERELVSERTRDKIAATRRKGMWTGGRPLLGYDVERDARGARLVVNSDEAERLRSIFELYLELGSLQQTVAELHRRSWPTKRWIKRDGVASGGKPFSKSSLFSLLTNVVYIGQIRYRDEIHDGEQEPIVPDELWSSVQARLRSGRVNGAARARNKHNALLRGLLRCGACDCSMSHSFTVKNGRRYSYYVCNQASKKGWKTCPSPSIPAGEIERFVVDQIRHVGHDEAVIARTITEVRNQQTAQIAERERDRRLLIHELRACDEALETVTDAEQIVDLHRRARAGRERLQVLDEEIQAGKTCHATPDEIRAALTEFDGVWAALTGRERCRLVEELVESVTYDGAAGEIVLSFHDTDIDTPTKRTEDAA